MEELCGKCIPCRVGTVQIYKLLTRISEGQGTKKDIVKLRELCQMVKTTSLCGLGQSAPNPVLSTLKYFEHEYTLRLVEDTLRNGSMPSASRNGEKLTIEEAANVG